MFISHYHDLEDGFSNLEEGSEWIEDDRASLSSIVHRSAIQSSMGRAAIFAPEVSNLIYWIWPGCSREVQDVRALASLSDAVTVGAEVKAYLQNIVTFLRMNRAVEGGISPRATKHFDLLVKYAFDITLMRFLLKPIQVSGSSAWPRVCDAIFSCVGCEKDISPPDCHYCPRGRAKHAIWERSHSYYSAFRRYNSGSCHRGSLGCCRSTALSIMWAATMVFLNLSRP